MTSESVYTSEAPDIEPSSEFDCKNPSGLRHLQASLSHLTGFFKSCEVAATCAPRESPPGPPAALESPQRGAQLTGCAFAFAMPTQMSARWALDLGAWHVGPTVTAVLELVPSVPS